MTVKELVEITGKSERTILRIIREIYPFLLSGKGKQIKLEPEQAYKILNKMESKFSLESLRKNEGQEGQNAKPERRNADLKLHAEVIKQLRLAKRNDLLEIYFRENLQKVKNSFNPEPLKIESICGDWL